MKTTYLNLATTVATRAMVLAALICPPAWAFDLSTAYQQAMEHDATLAATKAATDAKRERIPQALAQLLPNLSANASQNRNALESTAPNFLGKSTTTNRVYSSGNRTLTLKQPLFRKYQLTDYEQAKEQVNDANALLEKETANVAVRVSGAYFEALQAEVQLALVAAQKTAYVTQLDAAQKRMKSGMGTRTDIDEAQAAVDLNLAQELEARQQREFTRRQLQVIANTSLDDRMAAVDPERLVLADPAPNRLEDWLEKAEANSPEIQSLKAQLEVARLEVEKASAGHYPTLDAIAQWAHSESENVNSANSSYTNRTIGLQLNVPIYGGGYVSSLVRQSLADQERATQALEALRLDLAVRIHREFRGVTEGVLKVKALEQAVRSADQAVISNRRSYEAGSRTLMDTLNAEQQKVAAQRDLSQARLIYLMARVRLQALSGGPGKAVIDEINSWLK